MDLGAAFMEYDGARARFATPLALPLLPVPRKAATFGRITRETMLRLANTKRSRGSNYNRVDLYTEDDNYSCVEDGLEGVLGDDDRANYANDFDAEMATVTQIQTKLMLNLEVEAAAALFNAVTWLSTDAALYTDYSSAPWDNIASDIIGQIITKSETVRLNCSVRPNALLVGAASLANMLKNTGIKAQFPAAPIITRAMIESALPAIFGLDRLIVGGQVYDASKEGQSFSGTDIWGDDYAMIGVFANPGDPVNTPCVGRTFLWTPDSPDLVTVDQYREERVRGDIFRCRHHKVIKIMDAYFGHLLKVDA
jgi:hypothetical protein